MRLSLAILIFLAALPASAQSAAQASLSWTNVVGEAGYQLERSQGGTTTYALLASTLADAVTHTDAPLTLNTLYCYRVRADYGSWGFGPYSADACVQSPNTGQTIQLQIQLSPQ